MARDATTASAATERRRWAIPAEYREAAFLWFAVRLGLGVLAALLVLERSAASPCSFDLPQNGWTTLPPLVDSGVGYPLVGVWEHNDACWYAKIAAHGYEPGQHSTAFFPLLPMLMRAVAPAVGGDVVLAGLVVNAVAFVVGVAGVIRLVSRDVERDTASRTALYLAVFPGSFFLFAPFTEALFLAGAAWTLLGARTRDWSLAAGAGFLAGLTRIHAVLLVIPVAWEVLRAFREREAGSRPGREAVGWLAALAAPAAAVALYYAFTSLVVGETFVQAQSLWGGAQFRLPWELTADAWRRIGEGDAVTLINVLVLAAFTALTVVGLRELPLSYSLYVIPALALVFLRSPTFPFMSAVRYAAVLFPCFVVLAIVGRSRTFSTGWLIVSTALLGFLATRFVQGAFIA